MLSVLALKRALNNDAALPFFLVCTVAVDEASSGSGLLADVAVDGLRVRPCIASMEGGEAKALPLSLLELAPALNVEALIDASSSCSSSDSSLRACEGLNDRARLSRDLRPALREGTALGCVDIIAARSLSSRDIRFSEAVKFPCDSGEGRVKRGAGEVEDADEDVGVVGDEADAVVETDGRDDAAVPADVEEEADPFRWWGLARWLGLGEPVRCGGGGVLRADPEAALEPVLLRDRLLREPGGGVTLWPLWLLLVLWRWLLWLEFTDEVEPEASGRM